MIEVTKMILTTRCSFVTEFALFTAPESLYKKCDVNNISALLVKLLLRCIRCVYVVS